MTLECFCGRLIRALEIQTSATGPLGTVLGGVWENPDIIYLKNEQLYFITK